MNGGYFGGADREVMKKNGIGGALKGVEEEVVVIVGPTGSGKTGLGIELALERRGGGLGAVDGGGGAGVAEKKNDRKDGFEKGTSGGEIEIISADSRAIYKYMNIGTAKPSEKEMCGVRHWGIDLVEPGERFTVADWKKYAEDKIREVRERGNIPMVVGGTGLYIDALVYGYQFNEQNSCSDREEMCSGYKIFGIRWEAETLRKRLVQRLNKIFVQEMYDETRLLVEKYGWGSQAMKSNAYQFVWAYLRGEMGLEEAKEKAFYSDWHLAKRQMTWFKRNSNIDWGSLEEVKKKAETCLS